MDSGNAGSPRLKSDCIVPIPHHSIILPEILFLTHLLPSVHSTSLSLSGIRVWSFKLVYLTSFHLFLAAFSRRPAARK